MSSTITAAELYAEIAQGLVPQILDVRNADEYAAGAVEGSQPVPTSDHPGWRSTGALDGLGAKPPAGRVTGCGKGEGGPFVEDGKLRVGGALPTNTDGGGLSACHPGMRGMFLMVEAVKQLRGEAGNRQVANANIACVNGTGGWFSSAATLLLGIE